MTTTDTPQAMTPERLEEIREDFDNRRFQRSGDTEFRELLTEVTRLSAKAKAAEEERDKRIEGVKIITELYDAATAAHEKTLAELRAAEASAALVRVEAAVVWQGMERLLIEECGLREDEGLDGQRANLIEMISHTVEPLPNNASIDEFTIMNLRGHLFRVIARLQKLDPEAKPAKQAWEWLMRNNLGPSILRGGSLAPAEGERR